MFPTSSGDVKPAPPQRSSTRAGRRPSSSSKLGDLVALEHAEYRVVIVVDTEQTFPIAALVKVRPAQLRLAAR